MLRLLVAYLFLVFRFSGIAQKRKDCMRMRTLTGVAVLLVIVASVAFATVPNLGLHFRQGPKDLGRKIDESVSDPHVEGVYKDELEAARKGLENDYCKVYAAKAEIADYETACVTLKKELAMEEEVLKRARQMLEKSQPGSTIVVGKNAKFTWEEINQDALNRVSSCEVLRKRLSLNEQSVSALRQMHEDGLKKIQAKQDELRRAKLDFDIAKIEAAAIRAQERMGAAYNVGDSDSNLGAARKLFFDRQNDRRARVESTQKMGLRKSSAIPWNQELGFSEKATDSIKSYFEGSKNVGRN